MFNSTAAINTVMGLMSHLNSTDLKEILNDDNKFEQYAKELQSVSNCLKNFIICWRLLYYIFLEQRFNRYRERNVNCK